MEYDKALYVQKSGKKYRTHSSCGYVCSIVLLMTSICTWFIQLETECSQCMGNRAEGKWEIPENPFALIFLLNGILNILLNSCHEVIANTMFTCFDKCVTNAIQCKLWHVLSPPSCCSTGSAPSSKVSPPAPWRDHVWCWPLPGERLLD